jgi:hypothetical protein
MHDYPIDPRDEERHEPTSERFWSESYYFDFHDEQGSLGGYVRIGLYPTLGVTWQWAALVGAGRPLVTAINHHAPLPAPGTLEVSCPGLKADHECRSQNQRFGVIVEASAVALQDPAQVYGSMEGKATPLAFDLEWETDGPGGYRFRQMTRYEISCRVRGRIRVGDERIEFSGHGQRDHSWGVRDLRTMPLLERRPPVTAPASLRGASHARRRDRPLRPLRPGTRGGAGGIESSRAREELGTHGFPVRGRIEVGDLHLDLSPLYFAPVLMVDPDGRVARFPRSLARFFHADGRRGLGWIEWNQIQPQRSPA